MSTVSDDGGPGRPQSFSGSFEPPRIFFAVLTPILTAYLIVTMVMFYRRRHLQPIRARPVRMTLIMGFMVIVYELQQSASWVWREGHPCWLVQTFLWPPVIIALNIYLMRVWELWFRFQLTAQKSAYLRVSAEAASDDPAQPIKPYALWYLQNKYYGSSKFIFHFCFIKSLCENLVLMSPLFYGTTVTDTYGAPGEVVCPQTQWATWPYLAIVFYDFMLFSFAAVKFGALQDGFFMKAEMRYMGVSGLCTMVAWLSLELADIHLFPFDSASLFLGNFAFTTAFLFYPIYKSYKMLQRKSSLSLLNAPEILGHGATFYDAQKDYVDDKRSSVQSASDVCLNQRALGQSSSARSSAANTSGSLALIGVLADPDKRLLFREHVKLELSIENLALWEEVQRFRELFDGKPKDDSERSAEELALIENAARDIMEKFIFDDAPLLVNVHAKVHNDLRAKWAVLHGEEPPEEDAAQKTSDYFRDLAQLLGRVPTGMHRGGGGTNNERRNQVSPSPTSPSDPAPQNDKESSASPVVVPIDFFDDVQDKVYRLMARDTFIRFKAKHRNSLSQKKTPETTV